MKPITHILFPYDFSAHGKRIAPLVRSMAAHFNAKVTLYSVVPPVWEDPPVNMRPVVGDTSDEWKQSLHGQLDTALRSELAGLTVERVADVGDPAMRISAFTEQHDVDLVMMPTRGHGAFRSFLVGSVTAKVLHDVACPVWTSAHNDEEVAPHVPKTIICAIDATERAPALCRRAIDLSSAMGATLRFLHVAPVVSDFIELEAEKNLQDRVRQTAENGMRDMLSRADIAAPLDVMAGEIGPCVAEYARCEKADLVIAARGAINEPVGRFRAHTPDIIAQSPCPVLSI